MKKTILLVLSFWSLTLVTACTQTSIIPHTGGMYSVIASADNEDKASTLAKEKAQSICAHQQATAKVIDQETRYQGVDKDQQQLIKLAHRLLPSNKQTTSYTPVDHEYKTTLVFRCE